MGFVSSSGMNPGDGPGENRSAVPAPDVQAKGDMPDQDPDNVRQTAADGVSGTGSALPHHDRIAASFGESSQSLEGVRAHVGGSAGEAADAIGAEAYATGKDIAFAKQPDLHTAAHEAAHVVQQQAGVQLSGGVGAPGDQYEKHADAVADRVVAGESAADMFSQMTPSGSQTGVQSKVVQLDIKSDLGSAMDGWGTDEDAIYNRLGRASAAELRVVINDRALMARLRDELSDSEMKRVLDLLNAPLADKLDLAMRGWGTDEAYIHQCLARATPADLQAIANNTVLVNRLESELSGDDLRSVLNRLAVSLSRKLEYAVRGWGTDEAYIFDSIQNAPIAEVIAVANNQTLLGQVDGDLSGGELHRFRGMLAQRINASGDPQLAFRVIMGSADARSQRLAWVGDLVAQRALLDAVIINGSNPQAMLQAFQSYWSVETDVVNGATAWPPEALRQIHVQMKALPSQDSRSGVWQRLRLTGASNLTNRAAWNGSSGVFSVGAQAAQSAANRTTDLSAAAAAGASTIDVANGAAFGAGNNISIGDGANRELARIASISANTYTLSNPLANAHAAGEKLLPVTSEYGHGTALRAPATASATTIRVREPARFAVNDTIALDRLGPNRDVAKVTAITGDQYTIDTALSHAHPAGEEVTPDDNTATRRVNWLAATVRHEIGHAVETAMGGVTGFTVGLGGWWTGTSFDTWANAMGNPWASNDPSLTISNADKATIKATITDYVLNAKGSLYNNLPATHVIKTLQPKQVAVIEAAEACLSRGDNFFNSPASIFAANSKRFSVSAWYKRFQYHDEVVHSQRLKNYGLYAPAEFFAEAYTVFYEEAGRPGISDADHGRLVRNSTWRNWIRTNVHNRGLAPAGTGAGGSSPGGEEGAQPGSAGYGKASGNPGP